MITPCQMYWLVKLDDIRLGIANLMWLPITWLVITAIVSVAALAATADEEQSLRERVWRRIKKAMLLCIPMPFLMVALQLTAAFIPSTKQMAAIVVVPKLVNSEKVQTAGNKLYDIAVEWMDELKPRKDGAKEAK